MKQRQCILGIDRVSAIEQSKHSLNHKSAIMQSSSDETNPMMLRALQARLVGLLHSTVRGSEYRLVALYWYTMLARCSYGHLGRDIEVCLQNLKKEKRSAENACLKGSDCSPYLISGGHANRSP
jgi:hypothetical protein